VLFERTTHDQGGAPVGGDAAPAAADAAAASAALCALADISRALLHAAAHRGMHTPGTVDPWVPLAVPWASEATAAAAALAAAALAPSAPLGGVAAGGGGAALPAASPRASSMGSPMLTGRAGALSETPRLGGLPTPLAPFARSGRAAPLTSAAGGAGVGVGVGAGDGAGELPFLSLDDEAPPGDETPRSSGDGDDGDDAGDAGAAFAKAEREAVAAFGDALVAAPPAAALPPAHAPAEPLWRGAALALARAWGALALLSDARCAAPSEAAEAASGAAAARAAPSGTPRTLPPSERPLLPRGLRRAADAWTGDEEELDEDVEVLVARKRARRSREGGAAEGEPEAEEAEEDEDIAAGGGGGGGGGASTPPCGFAARDATAAARAPSASLAPRAPRALAGAALRALAATWPALHAVPWAVHASFHAVLARARFALAAEERRIAGAPPAPPPFFAPPPRLAVAHAAAVARAVGADLRTASLALLSFLPSATGMTTSSGTRLFDVLARAEREILAEGLAAAVAAEGEDAPPASAAAAAPPRAVVVGAADALAARDAASLAALFGLATARSGSGGGGGALRRADVAAFRRTWGALLRVLLSPVARLVPEATEDAAT
jgi:hypothetical protein